MPDHALCEQTLEVQHALAIGLQEAFDRHVGELRHDFRHIRRAHARGPLFAAAGSGAS